MEKVRYSLPTLDKDFAGFSSWLQPIYEVCCRCGKLLMVLDDKYPKTLGLFWRALLVCTSCILSEQELAAMGMLIMMTQTIMLFTLHPVVFQVHVLIELFT